ncbi:MAG TPA: hypothetical protein VLQ79_06210 [Myxococcaceae bacterium]|nr:hypothetical protein [Myxococcaceae bacterium]
MTTPKTPRPEPGTPGNLATDRDQLSSSARSSRIVAVAAIVIALAALGLTAARSLAPSAKADDCQARAWAVTPAKDALPANWTASASQYDLSRKTLSFLGPQPTDGTSSQAVVYVTVTCFAQGAADGVTLSQKAAEDAGQSVVSRDDLGYQAFSAVDTSGAEFIQLRHGDIVVYLAGSADASATEVDELASAFDKALGGDGGTITPPTIAPSVDPGAGSLDPGAGSLDPGAGSLDPGAGSLDPGTASLDPSASAAAASPAAPDLIAALPSKVGNVTLTSDSATGTTILGEDQGSHAILAALRQGGKKAADLRVAQAYDTATQSDLSILALTVDGMPIAQTKKLVMDTWLTASGPGVTQSEVTLNGKTWTRVDYGDEGMKDYILAAEPKVIVITTADPKLAEQAAAALP